MLIIYSARNMQAAWKIIQKKYPHICVGCADYSLQNLIKGHDCIKIMTVKCFKNIHI